MNARPGNLRAAGRDLNDRVAGATAHDVDAAVRSDRQGSRGGEVHAQAEVDAPPPAVPMLLIAAWIAADGVGGSVGSAPTDGLANVDATSRFSYLTWYAATSLAYDHPFGESGIPSVGAATRRGRCLR